MREINATIIPEAYCVVATKCDCCDERDINLMIGDGPMVMCVVFRGDDADRLYLEFGKALASGAVAMQDGSAEVPLDWTYCKETHS